MRLASGSISATLFLLACLVALPDAAAQTRGSGGGREVSRSGLGASLPVAGLSAAFHGGAACAPVASPYGSPTRYDGSLRKTGGAEGGLHGGIDLSLDEGTPLLAIAAGRVFAAGEGGMLEGIFLWVLHLPEDTGLSFAFLAKYQHLREPSPLRQGESVRAGQEVARAGKTGTVGGHYGARGYPHLHLTVRALTDDGLKLASAGSGEFRILRDTVMVDPLTVYMPGIAAPADTARLPEERKTVTIAHVDLKGTSRPAGARLVWPVACP